MYRVSQVKEKITKFFSWGLKRVIAQFTSATVVQEEKGNQAGSRTDGGGCQGSPPVLQTEVS